MGTGTGMIVASAAELAKLYLQTSFQFARMSGMSVEQIDQNYQRAKARFVLNQDLPDVPPDD